MSWLQFGLSLLAVLALGGIARLLGLGGEPIESEAQVRALAEDMLSGFEAERAVVAPDRRAAVVLGRAGDVALVRRNGGKAVARRRARPLALARDGAALTIETGERFFGSFRIALADEAAARALATELTRV